MKHVLIILSLVLSGCAVGNIEGTGRMGEVLRSIEKTNAVITGHSSSRITTGKINRAAGHIKALQDKKDPVIVLRDVLDIYKYTQ